MSDTFTMTRNEHVTAFFDTEAEAEAAVSRIVAEGIPRDRIRVVAGNDAAGLETDHEPRQKGFFEALSDFFLPDEDRHTYAEGLSRGGFLVSLDTTPDNRDRILAILDDEGTVDMDEREASWRSEGWAAYQDERAPVAAAISTAVAAATDAPIEVLEETLRVGKREVEQGRVRVRSYVVETPVEEEVILRGETVHIDRRTVDRAVNPDEAFADRVIEATETAEEAVVSKEARVVEEISLGRSVDTRTETVRDTVRHTEVEVEDNRPVHADRTK